MYLLSIYLVYSGCEGTIVTLNVTACADTPTKWAAMWRGIRGTNSGSIVVEENGPLGDDPCGRRIGSNIGVGLVLACDETSSVLS